MKKKESEGSQQSKSLKTKNLSRSKVGEESDNAAVNNVSELWRMRHMLSKTELCNQLLQLKEENELLNKTIAEFALETRTLKLRQKRKN